MQILYLCKNGMYFQNKKAVFVVIIHHTEFQPCVNHQVEIKVNYLLNLKLIIFQVLLTCHLGKDEWYVVGLVQHIHSIMHLAQMHPVHLELYLHPNFTFVCKCIVLDKLRRQAHIHVVSTSAINLIVIHKNHLGFIDSAFLSLMLAHYTD